MLHDISFYLCMFCGQPVIGVVNAPILGEMFTAVKGQGAFCNGTKLTVSSIQGEKSLSPVYKVRNHCLQYTR